MTVAVARAVSRVETNDDRRAWVRLALTAGIGPRLVERLLERLGSVRAVAEASSEALRELLGPVRGLRVADGLRRADPDDACRRARALGQRVLTPVDDEWPRGAFEALEDPPLCLFLCGRLPPPTSPTVAIVGTREAGTYGLRVARRLAEDLARGGAWIISGLAPGIDGAAHRGALHVPGEDAGSTVAVLGCGVDVPYPAEHQELKQTIAEAGGVLSEHPPGTRARPGHFPRRNRIVAALADAVVVIEAPWESGALITAARALSMGREILAVPGPVTGPNHRGSHRLLRGGEAAVCEGARDVWAALGCEAAHSTDVPRDGRVAQPPPGIPLALWGLLEVDEIASADDLCRRSRLDPSDVAAALAQLELDGYVARVPGLGVRRL